VNPGVNDPRNLEAGTEIFVPSSAAKARRTNPRENFVPPDASGTITVHVHDSLWSIARAHFGHGTAWTCLVQANPQISDPNFVLPGQQLSMPASCTELP
jgi:nucleoid-associated protein YgaU